MSLYKFLAAGVRAWKAQDLLLLAKYAKYKPRPVYTSAVYAPIRVRPRELDPIKRLIQNTIKFVFASIAVAVLLDVVII